MRIAEQGVVQTPVPTRIREIFDQLGRRREARLEAQLDRAIPDRDGEMRFASSRRAQEDE